MRIYLGPRALEPELEGQKLLAVRPPASSLEELRFERRAPCALSSLGEQADFVFRYEIFPDYILRYWGEWQGAGRSMRVGDTIVQEAAVPPVPWGVRLLFGARVTEVSRSPLSVSFTYATLTSHAETGVNSFGLELSGGEAVAWITSRAEPGHPLMLLAGPVVMRYADWCKEQAVTRMLARFLAATP